MIKEHLQFQLYDKKVFERAVIEPPFRIAARMPNDACFYYLIEGCAKAIAPTNQLELMSSEGVVLQCGNYLNEYLSSNSETTYCEAIAVHFYPEVLKMIYDKEFPDFLLNVNQIQPLKIEKIKTDELLRKYIDSLQFYFSNPDMVSDELLKLKLKELILLLAKSDQADMIRTLLGSMFSREEINFKEVIEANLYNNLTIEELAILTNLSLSSFKREFTKQYNSSPAKYIKQRRLKKAAKLLQSTSLRVSDIAYDCGFQDVAHFSKVFLKEHGASPTGYRDLIKS